MLAGMVRETGHAAEQFLRSVASGQGNAFEERDQKAASALQRVNTTPDWQTDCRYECCSTFSDVQALSIAVALSHSWCSVLPSPQLLSAFWQCK